MGAIAPHQQQASVADERLTVLHERHGRHVLRHCRRYAGSDSEADDAFQVTFVHAMRGLRSGVVPQHELAWLLAIARNVCREQWRTHQRRPRLVDDLDAVPDTRSPFDSDRSLVLDLDAALSQLSPRHRTAIVLREWRGLSYAEIAAQMGLTEPAVETMLVRARRELTSALEQGAQPKKRRASWRDLGWLAELVRRIASQGAAAKLVTGAAVVAVTVSAGGASPASSEIRGATHASPSAPAVRATGRDSTVLGGTRRNPEPRSGSAVSTTPSGPTTASSPGLTPRPPAEPRQADPLTPPTSTKTGPTATAPAASPPAVLPPTVTVPALTAHAPTLTVTVPAVALPDPLPSTPTVTVTTPNVVIRAPTVTVDLPGP